MVASHLENSRESLDPSAVIINLGELSKLEVRNWSVKLMQCHTLCMCTNGGGHLPFPCQNPPSNCSRTGQLCSVGKEVFTAGISDNIIVEQKIFCTKLKYLPAMQDF